MLAGVVRRGGTLLIMSGSPAFTFMHQILPNLRVAFLCSFFIAAAALSPVLFSSKHAPRMSPVSQHGMEILALER